MNGLIIRELTTDDAEQLIAYTKQIGGESDNLTFGADGFPVTAEKVHMADYVGRFCGAERPRCGASGRSHNGS